jgi:hypothetical protein
MNNLNLLSQKITYDSIVNKHLRSSQQQSSEPVRRSSKNPIYQPTVNNKERTSAAGSAKLSATLKQPANSQIGRYAPTGTVNLDREAMIRTLEQDTNSLAVSRAMSDAQPRDADKRNFYGT